MLFNHIKTWWNSKKPNIQTNKGKLCGPFHPLSDFEVGDLVTVKPGVCPGGRLNVPVEEIGPMMIHGKIQTVIMVMGLPYYPDELILTKKKSVIPETINGLWH